MRLAETTFDGAAAATPLLIAHGLFGSGRNWGVIAKRLSAGRKVVTVDMRNHGRSGHDPDHTYPALAADLADTIAAHGGRMDVLGHSMGGKAAMVLALARPELVGRLVVADIAPVAYGHTQMPVIDALRATDLAGVTRRQEASERLLPHLHDPALAPFLLQSLDLSSEPPRWRFNLDALATHMDAILGFPDVDGQFGGPTLFLTGAESDYVRPVHRDRIRALFPAARFARLPGAGHWLHADRPREFVAAVDTFLKMPPK